MRSAEMAACDMHEVAVLFCGGDAVRGRRYCPHHLRQRRDRDRPESPHVAPPEYGSAGAAWFSHSGPKIPSRRTA
jgi:hypothetical protein